MVFHQQFNPHAASVVFTGQPHLPNGFYHYVEGNEHIDHQHSQEVYYDGGNHFSEMDSGTLFAYTIGGHGEGYDYDVQVDDANHGDGTHTFCQQAGERTNDAYSTFSSHKGNNRNVHIPDSLEYSGTEYRPQYTNHTNVDDVLRMHSSSSMIEGNQDDYDATAQYDFGMADQYAYYGPQHFSPYFTSTLQEDYNEGCQLALPNTHLVDDFQLPNWHYPPPDVLRRKTNLLGFVCALPPERRLNATRGPRLHIIEEETGTVLMHSVPKKVLILFCGRDRISTFLRTQSEDAETGKPTQFLHVPRAAVNYIGLKIMVAWMLRACNTIDASTLYEIRIPNGIFNAISLARALEFFNQRQDALRVDRAIDKLFQRALYPDEIKEIWNLLPKGSKYTYRMIKQLAHLFAASEHGALRALPHKEETVKFINEHDDLYERVKHEKVNELFKPAHKKFKNRHGEHKMAKGCSKVPSVAPIHEMPLSGLADMHTAPLHDSVPQSSDYTLEW